MGITDIVLLVGRTFPYVPSMVTDRLAAPCVVQRLRYRCIRTGGNESAG